MRRRRALMEMGSAGAALLLGPTLKPRWPGLRLGGRAVEVAAAAVSPSTLRLTILGAAGAETSPIPLDGALIDPPWSPQLRMAPPSRTGAVGAFRVQVEGDPLRIRVTQPDGRQLQDFAVDPASGAVSFPLGAGPLLGMGQGGPQFDRRGSTYTPRSGQGGYQLRTHGGRVPIQWLISADGWALYFHQPLGAFDLTGPRGRFDPPQDAPLPLDVFVVDARDPVAAMGEFARLTGTPEMPPSGPSATSNRTARCRGPTRFGAIAGSR